MCRVIHLVSDQLPGECPSQLWMGGLSRDILGIIGYPQSRFIVFLKNDRVPKLDDSESRDILATIESA